MTTGPLPVDPPETGDASMGQSFSTQSAKRRHLAWILPVGVLLVGFLITRLLVWTQDHPEPREPEITTPLVRVMTVAQEPVRYEVIAHGTVTPRTESDLVAEVRGRIVEVSDSFAAGAFFAEGDTLVRLDEREYRISVDRARASLKLRTSEWRLALADAKRRRELADRGAVSDAELEQFESRAAVAAASRDESRAALAQAQLDLERTALRAPFEGRVRSRDVDLGQFVSPGQSVGRVYGIGDAEVRLAVPTSDLAYLDLSMGGNAQALPETRVTLSAEIGGREASWDAKLVRTEGDIDLRTRMVNVVARIEDPFSRKDSTHEPLPAGLFVRAVIQGKSLDSASVLPLMALRENDQVFVIDSEDRLRVRSVEVLRRSHNSVIVGEGLSSGERLVISPLRVYTDAMPVRVFEGDAP